MTCTVPECENHRHGRSPFCRAHVDGLAEAMKVNERAEAVERLISNDVAPSFDTLETRVGALEEAVAAALRRLGSS